MLSSYEWALLQILTTELQTLEILDKDEDVQHWMKNKIKELKEKQDDS